MKDLSAIKVTSIALNDGSSTVDIYCSVCNHIPERKTEETWFLSAPDETNVLDLEKINYAAREHIRLYHK